MLPVYLEIRIITSQTNLNTHSELQCDNLKDFIYSLDETVES